jgi:AraC-like DNA-binding protein
MATIPDAPGRHGGRRVRASPTSAEGKSYNTVEKDALAIVARRLLRDEQRSIQEAAYEMGFSDTTAFHRAFKRWTGTTPSAYQESR